MDIKKILLTGNRGFIGKHLYDNFEKNGYQVNTLEMDYLIDPFWKPKLYNKVKMSDIIFHVGAISDTKLQDSGTMLFYNYEFSRVLIDYAYELNKKIVYSSSAANAGSGDGIPNNIYGWSKLLTENYGIAKGGGFVALRYFNVYGPGEEEKGDMASIAYQAYKNKKIKLFPLKPTRDFVYIEDVVNSNLQSFDAPTGVYEVGTGESNTFETLIDNMGIKYTYTSEDKIPSWYQFNTKADKNKFLPGWYPEYNIKRGTKLYKKYLNERYDK